MKSIKTPSGGFDRSTLQVPAMDFAAATVEAVEAPGASIALEPGLYFIVVDGDFSFAHAPAAEIGGITVRAPWFANVYLSLFIDVAQTLQVDVADDVQLTIIPAKVYG